MIYTHTGEYTDVHGITHTNPVFVLTDYSTNTSENKSFDYRTGVPSSSTPNKSSNLSCSFVYYTNQAEKDAGSQPLQFMGGSANMPGGRLSSSQYDPEVDVEQQCLGLLQAVL